MADRGWCVVVGVGMSTLLWSGHGLAAEDTSSDSVAQASAREPTPGYDDFEHWVPLAVSVTSVPGIDFTSLLLRGGYGAMHQGWGITATVSLKPGQADGGNANTVTEELITGRLALRRGLLLSPLRLWFDAGIGVLRAQRGDQDFDQDALLYHATSSNFELGVELGRSWWRRPFLSAEFIAPWFKTESEQLMESADASGAGVVRIRRTRSWTPGFSVSAGIAF